MSKRLSLEEKHRLMKEALSRNLKKKLLIEISLNEQFEKLKKLEIALEKARVGGEADREAQGLLPSAREEVVQRIQKSYNLQNFRESCRT
jgi:hypothetical protein